MNSERIKSRIDTEGFDVYPLDPSYGAKCVGKKKRDRKKAGSYYQKCEATVVTVLSLEIPGSGSIDIPLCPNCMKKLGKNIIDCI